MYPLIEGTRQENIMFLFTWNKRRAHLYGYTMFEETRVELCLQT